VKKTSMNMPKFWILKNQQEEKRVVKNKNEINSLTPGSIP
jgi:hypothetical protein